MSQEAVAHAVTSMGLEVVDVLRVVLGTSRWLAGVVPFARVRRAGTEVDIVLPSALDVDGYDQSRVLRDAIAERPALRARLVQLSTTVAVALDGAWIAWDWAAVRVRRTPEGGSRAGIELGRGAPLARPLDLLEQPTVIPPTVGSLEAPSPAHGRPSFLPQAAYGMGGSIPPAAIATQSIPPAPVAPGVSGYPSYVPPGNVLESEPPMAVTRGYLDVEPSGARPSISASASPSLGQPELAKTIARAQGVIGQKQEMLTRALVGHTGAHLVPRDRAVEFVYAGGKVRRYACDQIGMYNAVSGFWRWGWAIEGWSAAARSQSEKLRVTGVNWRLGALTEPTLAVAPDSAFRLGLMSAWVLGAEACHFVRGDGGDETVVAIHGVA